MQYFMSVMYALLQFIPCLILSLFYLIDLRRSKGEERTSTLLGFLAFATLTLAFFLMTSNVFLTDLTDLWHTDFYFLVIDPPYMTITQSILGAGFILLALWTVANTRPDWLQRHKVGFATAGLILWVMFTISAILLFFLSGVTHRLHLLLPIHLAQNLLAAFPTLMTIGNMLRFTSLTIVFFLAFACTLRKAATEFTAVILFAGLVLLYLLNSPIISFHFVTIYSVNLMLLGICLILSWYIVDKMEKTAPSPAKYISSSQDSSF